MPKIDVLANTTAAQRSVKDLSKAFDDVGDSLDDVARDGDRAGDKLESSFKSMVLDAGRAERAAKEVGDAGRSMGREVSSGGERGQRALDDLTRDAKRAERAVEDVGENGSRGLGKVKASAQEVQQEFGSNLAESVSSVRGDLSELGQVGQDTLGGLAGTIAGMGPGGLVGALALAAGAVGLGAVTAGIEEAKEKQEALNEAAAKFAEGYTTGVNGAIDAAQVFAEINAIATDPDRYKEAGENAKNWGVDVATAMRAMAGDATAIGTIEGALDRQAEALKRNAEGHDNYAQNIEAATTGQSTANDTYLKGRDALDQLTGAMDAGRQQAENAQRALYDYASTTGVATGKTDELGNAIVRLPDGKEVVLNAETKTAREDVDGFEKKVQGVQDKTVRMRVALDASEWDKWTPGAKVGRVRTAVEPGGGGGTTWF